MHKHLLYVTQKRPPSGAAAKFLNANSHLVSCTIAKAFAVSFDKLVLFSTVFNQLKHLTRNKKVFSSRAARGGRTLSSRNQRVFFGSKFLYLLFRQLVLRFLVWSHWLKLWTADSVCVMRPSRFCYSFLISVCSQLCTIFHFTFRWFGALRVLRLGLRFAKVHNLVDLFSSLLSTKLFWFSWRLSSKLPLITNN